MQRDSNLKNGLHAEKSESIEMVKFKRDHVSPSLSKNFFRSKAILHAIKDVMTPYRYNFSCVQIFEATLPQ